MVFFPSCLLEVWAFFITVLRGLTYNKNSKKRRCDQNKIPFSMGGIIVDLSEGLLWTKQFT